jgi:hypothetical protein
MGDQFRSRKHEAHAFWTSWRICRHKGTSYDAGSREFPELTQAVRNTLYRSGFTCRRQISACPDWILKTVPNIGAGTLATIRSVLPFTGSWHTVKCFVEAAPDD